MMTHAMELFEEMEKEMGGLSDGQGYEEYARSAFNSVGTQLGRKLGGKRPLLLILFCLVKDL